jgi:hypothetical protein
LTVALHPTDSPIMLRASATMPLDVCPGSSDGTTASGWPAPDFPTCRPLPLDVWVALPSTRSSEFHIGVQIRARTAGTLQRLLVSYRPLDTFTLVIAPTDSAAPVIVTFTPRLAAIADGASNLPSQASLATAHLSVEQGGRLMTGMGPCPFPSEFDMCTLGIHPGQLVTVRMDAVPKPGHAVGLGLQWFE